MKRLLQINSVVNTGSTGRIAEQIGEFAIAKGWESYIAYGREARESKSRLIKIGNKTGIYLHVALSRIFDTSGLHSRCATIKFIKEIKRIKPDVIHIHNLHGYYLNYPLLFGYLSQSGIPVVWTLHDCWGFTGHCAYFSYAGCCKWETQCFKCPQRKSYPKSGFMDNSRRNYRLKKKYFNSVANLNITTVSEWLGREVEKSFLSNNDRFVICNGVDVDKFYPRVADAVKDKYATGGKTVLLAAATSWEPRKGLADYMELRKHLPEQYIILLVGLTKEAAASLPEGIIGITRTESVDELAELYSLADVVLNLSYEETFGLTTAEGFACGTPGIVYNTTASPELITAETGIVVEAGNITKVVEAVCAITEKGKEFYSEACRKRATEFYDKTKRYKDYLDLYENLLVKP